MKQVSATEARAQFSQLVRLAEAGDAVRITRHGRPVAVLSAWPVPAASYSPLAATESLVDFSARMRQQAIDQGLDLF